jgi:hypothetical protein
MLRGQRAPSFTPEPPEEDSVRSFLGIRKVAGLGAAAALLSASGCAPPPATSTDAAAVADMGAGEGRVRSSLYPSDWTPGFRNAQGRFLHDVSYSGYKNGEVAPPSSPPGLIYDAVTKYGADPKGEKDSTAAIQRALDAAAGAGGGVVYLPAGLYRCDGLLDVSRSGVVLRGAGASQSRIYFTRAQGMTDLSHVTFHGTVTAGPLVPLASDGASQSFEVRVADSGGLSVGDDVSVGWVITPAFVEEHGMTGTWTVFLNQWKPFFRRQIRAIDRTVTPHRVTLEVPLRYPARLRDQAALRRETGYLDCRIYRMSSRRET